MASVVDFLGFILKPYCFLNLSGDEDGKVGKKCEKYVVCLPLMHVFRMHEYIVKRQALKLFGTAVNKIEDP